MASCALLAEDNIAYLDQALALVERLSDSAYALGGQPAYKSGIGGHLRHCLDHYLNFLAGLSSGRIDYDARARDRRVETDRAVALAVLREVASRLAALRPEDGDRAVQVKMDCGDTSDPATWWTASSVRRELQFLISHTVHHYALIAMIVKLQGLDPGPSFGVAPSTLRYEAAQPCAR